MRRRVVGWVAIAVGIAGVALLHGFGYWMYGEWWNESESRSEGPRQSADDARETASDQSTPYRPQGPEPPYERLGLGPKEVEDDERAPAYRNLPDSRGRVRVEEGDGTFPPVETDYDVDIRGDLASVTVEQIYYNSTDRTVDAVYQFPLNRRAAVFGMQMTVGDRTIEAEIKEDDRARELYDRANECGKKAALLSQERPNWFTQRVANIEPDEAIEVELQYVHPLPKEDGSYRLVIPTRLGKRFGDGSGSANDLVPGDGDDESLPTSFGVVSDRARKAPEAVDLDLQIDLEGPVPIRRLRSSSDPVRAHKYSPSQWWLAPDEEANLGDSHFELRFEMAGESTRTGLNTYWDEEAGRGYFSLLIEPPARPEPSSISNREIVFVMDTSGSMQGEPIETSKRFVTRALKSLRRKRDAFRIVRFSNEASGFSEKPIRVTDDSIQRATSYVESLSAGGGTEYEPGLKRAFQPETPTGAVRLVVFLTDGQIGYEHESLRDVKSRVEEARLFGIGIGSSPNRYLIDEMARVGHGFSAYFGQARAEEDGLEAEERIERTVERIESPVMTHIRVDWGSLDVGEISPHPVPDLYAGESIRIHGTYSNPGTHTVTVHGTVGAERVSIPATVEFPREASQGRAVELTWARQQIRENMHHMLGAKQSDEKGQRALYRHRVVELGLKHSLVTQWTSFVAVAESQEEGTPEESASISAGDRRSAPSSACGKGGKGHGGMGLSGTGHGGGGEGFDRVHGMGHVDTGDGKSTGGRKGIGANLGQKSQVHPEIVPRRPNVQGSLDKTIIRRVIRQHRRELKYCYQKRLRTKSEEFAGKLVLQLQIVPSGDVRVVSFEGLSDAKLRNCVRSRAQRWVFPAVKGGGPVEVNYPIFFQHSN